MFTTALLRGVARLLIVTVTAMTLQPLTAAAQASRAQSAQPAAAGPGERYAKQLGDIEETLMGAAPQVFFKGKLPADWVTVKAKVKTLRDQSRQLQQIEAAEQVLKKLGLRQVRVRHHDTVARIEVAPEEFPLVLEHREAIERELRALGYRYVTLDLKGFRSGSLNEGLKTGK